MEFPPRALPARHRIGSIELQAVAQVGAASILYSAWDHAHGGPVAVEEYLPAAWARRRPNGQVEPLDDASRGAFELGRRAFVERARTLARCEHPCLLRVLQLMQRQGTAYCVTPWYAGRPMTQLVGPRMPLAEIDLRSLLEDLLGALQAYHPYGGLHADLRPDKVLLLDDGHALLLAPDGAGQEQQRAPDGSVTTPTGPGPDLQGLARLARWCMGDAPPAGAWTPEFLHWLGLPFLLDEGQRPQTAAQYRQWLLRLPPVSQPASPGVDRPVQPAQAMAGAEAPWPGAGPAVQPLSPGGGRASNDRASARVFPAMVVALNANGWAQASGRLPARVAPRRRPQVWLVAGAGLLLMGSTAAWLPAVSKGPAALPAGLPAAPGAVQDSGVVMPAPGAPGVPPSEEPGANAERPSEPAPATPGGSGTVVAPEVKPGRSVGHTPAGSKGAATPLGVRDAVPTVAAAVAQAPGVVTARPLGQHHRPTDDRT